MLSSVITTEMKQQVTCGKDILRVCSEANQGMRKYMEDEVSIVIETEGRRTAFLGVFDGHGGKEASVYAKDNLYTNIKVQPGFNDDDPEVVKSAIRSGFIKTHWEMFRVVETWPKRKDGHNSTSGTTATVAIIRDNKLYIAHVGDSAAIIAKKENDDYTAEEITVDHKPDSGNEKSRIESLGGKVASTNGVPRVVWKRPVRSTSPAIGQPVTKYEYVPFLAVSRALGDLWSYDTDKNEFIVSPEPEITYIDIQPGYHKFVILASDGLWGVMDAKEAVDVVTRYEMLSHAAPDKRNCSEILINESLSLWQKKRSRADNISAVVAFFDEEFHVNQSSITTKLEEEEDTDVLSENEEDTPPMSRASSASSMVRQLAFHDSKFLEKKINFKSGEKNGCKRAKSEEEEEVINDGTNLLARHGSQGKRKNNDTSSTDCLKKVRTSLLAPIVSEDSHQCKIITVLSPESLYGLQLDEDFADDESDDTRPSVEKNSLHHRLSNPMLKKLLPVVNGAK